jgi:hypothetical protein
VQSCSTEDFSQDEVIEFRDASLRAEELHLIEYLELALQNNGKKGILN